MARVSIAPDRAIAGEARQAIAEAAEGSGYGGARRRTRGNTVKLRGSIIADIDGPIVPGVLDGSESTQKVPEFKSSLEVREWLTKLEDRKERQQVQDLLDSKRSLDFLAALMTHLMTVQTNASPMELSEKSSKRERSVYALAGMLSECLFQLTEADVDPGLPRRPQTMPCIKAMRHAQDLTLERAKRVGGVVNKDLILMTLRATRFMIKTLGNVAEPQSRRSSLLGLPTERAVQTVNKRTNVFSNPMLPIARHIMLNRLNVMEPLYADNEVLQEAVDYLSVVAKTSPGNAAKLHSAIDQSDPSSVPEDPYDIGLAEFTQMDAQAMVENCRVLMGNPDPQVSSAVSRFLMHSVVSSKRAKKTIVANRETLRKLNSEIRKQPDALIEAMQFVGRQSPTIEEGDEELDEDVQPVITRQRQSTRRTQLEEKADQGIAAEDPVKWMLRAAVERFEHSEGSDSERLVLAVCNLVEDCCSRGMAAAVIEAGAPEALLKFLTVQRGGTWLACKPLVVASICCCFAGIEDFSAPSAEHCGRDFLALLLTEGSPVFSHRGCQVALLDYVEANVLLKGNARLDVDVKLLLEKFQIMYTQCSSDIRLRIDEVKVALVDNRGPMTLKHLYNTLTLRSHTSQAREGQPLDCSKPGMVQKMLVLCNSKMELLTRANHRSAETPEGQEAMYGALSYRLFLKNDTNLEPCLSTGVPKLLFQALEVQQDEDLVQYFIETLVEQCKASSEYSSLYGKMENMPDIATSMLRRARLAEKERSDRVTLLLPRLELVRLLAINRVIFVRSQVVEELSVIWDFATFTGDYENDKDDLHLKPRQSAVGALVKRLSMTPTAAGGSGKKKDSAVVTTGAAGKVRSDSGSGFPTSGDSALSSKDSMEVGKGLDDVPSPSSTTPSTPQLRTRNSQPDQIPPRGGNSDSPNEGGPTGGGGGGQRGSLNLDALKSKLESSNRGNSATTTNTNTTVATTTRNSLAPPPSRGGMIGGEEGGEEGGASGGNKNFGLQKRRSTVGQAQAEAKANKKDFAEVKKFQAAQGAGMQRRGSLVKMESTLRAPIKAMGSTVGAMHRSASAIGAWIVRKRNASSMPEDDVLTAVFKCLRKTVSVHFLETLVELNFSQRLIAVIERKDTTIACLPDVLFLIGAISAMGDMKQKFGELGAVEALLGLLSAVYASDEPHVSQVLANACLALAGLTLIHKENSDRFVNQKGTNVVVELIMCRAWKNDSLANDGASALICNLSFKNELMKKKFGTKGAAEALVQVLKSFDPRLSATDSKISLRSLFKAIGNLSLNINNLEKFLDAHIEDGFANFLTRADEEVEEETIADALRTLSNLVLENSDSCMDLFKAVIPPLLSFLRRETFNNVTIHTWAFDIIGNLCRKPSNAEFFCQNDGIKTVLTLLLYLPPNVALHRSAIYVLGIQTTSRANIPTLVSEGLLDFVAQILANFARHATREAEGGSCSSSNLDSDSEDSDDDESDLMRRVGVNLVDYSGKLGDANVNYADEDQSRVSNPVLPIKALRCARRVIVDEDCALKFVGAGVFPTLVKIMNLFPSQTMLMLESCKVILTILARCPNHSLEDTTATSADKQFEGEVADEQVAPDWYKHQPTLSRRAWQTLRLNENHVVRLLKIVRGLVTMECHSRLHRFQRLAFGILGYFAGEKYGLAGFFAAANAPSVTLQATVQANALDVDPSNPALALAPPIEVHPKQNLPVLENNNSACSSMASDSGRPRSATASSSVIAPPLPPTSPSAATGTSSSSGRQGRSSVRESSNSRISSTSGRSSSRTASGSRRRFFSGRRRNVVYSYGRFGGLDEHAESPVSADSCKIADCCRRALYNYGHTTEKQAAHSAMLVLGNLIYVCSFSQRREFFCPQIVDEFEKYHPINASDEFQRHVNALTEALPAFFRNQDLSPWRETLLTWNYPLELSSFADDPHPDGVQSLSDDTKVFLRGGGKNVILSPTPPHKETCTWKASHDLLVFEWCVGIQEESHFPFRFPVSRVHAIAPGHMSANLVNFARGNKISIGQCFFLSVLATESLPSGTELWFKVSSERSRDMHVATLANWRDASAYGFY